jgi:hypothetical protein
MSASESDSEAFDALAFNARICALNLAFAELAEAVEHRMPGIKSEVAAALTVHEQGGCEVTSHPAGREELRQLRLSLGSIWS